MVGLNVERVTLENYRSYPDADVVLPLGATAIVGANGAGKSSLISAIDYALFAARGEGARHLRRGATTMSVTVNVEHHGDTYQVTRGYTASSGGKPTLMFLRTTDAEPHLTDPTNLTLESIDATAARIAETFGVTRETLRASSLLMQGDAAAWTEADPADRKRVLASVLGLEVWDRLHACAKRDLNAALEREIQARADVGTLAALDADLDRERIALVEAAGIESIAERDREAAALAATNATEMFEAARQHAARLRDFDAADAAHAYAIERAAAASAALEHRDAAEARLVELAREAARADDLESDAEDVKAKLAAHRALLVARDTAKREADAASVTLENFEARVHALGLALEGIATTCPTCGQDLAGDALERAREQARAAMLAADAERLAADEVARHAARRLADTNAALEVAGDPTPLEDQLTELQGSIAEARAAARAIEHAETNVKPRDEMVAAHAAAHRDVEAAQDVIDELGDRPLTDPTPLSKLEDDWRIAIENSTRAASVLAERRLSCSRREGRIAALAERREPIAHAGDALDLALNDADLFTRLVDAYSRNGVPAVIVDQQAVPALEANANGILEQLDAPMRVELRTQRATKKGDVRETLDVIVHAGGGESLYSDFSGGEKTRLNVALRIALALLLSSRRGADVRMLVVDEPEYLDVDGHERLADLLRGLAAEQFDRVLLVSHEPALRDSLDQYLAVTKDEHGNSRLETPA